LFSALKRVGIDEADAKLIELLGLDQEEPEDEEEQDIAQDGDESVPGDTEE
jgi:GTP-binding protein